MTRPTVADNWQHVLEIVTILLSNVYVSNIIIIACGQPFAWICDRFMDLFESTLRLDSWDAAGVRHPLDLRMIRKLHLISLKMSSPVYS